MKDYPVIIITASFISGIILNAVTSERDDVFVFALAAVFAFSAIVCLLLYFRKSLYRKTFLLVLMCMLAAAAGIFLSGSKLKVQSLEIHKEKGVIVTGEITSIELRKDHAIIFNLSCDSLLFSDSTSVKNIKLLARVYENEDQKLDSVYRLLNPGNKVELRGIFSSGKERRNPGEFDFRKYLLTNEISGTITSVSTADLKIVSSEKNAFKSWITSIRRSIDEIIFRFHTNTTAGLLRGLLLADRSEISPEVKTDFIHSGVVHILAVSGLHVGYIVMIFVVITGRLNIRLRLLLTIVGVILFLIITNSPASVFRATIMCVVIMVSRLTGRDSNIFNSLSLAALILLIIDTNELFNPGFQLSFSAVLSIAVFMPAFKKIINSGLIKSGLLKSMFVFGAVSLSAQLGTLPFTLMYFGKFSLIGIIANLIVIPLAGLIIAVAILTLSLSVLSSLLASLAAETNMFLSQSLFQLVQLSANLEFSYLSVRNFSITDSIVFYFNIIFILIFYKKFTNPIPKIIFICLTVFNILILTSIDDKPVFPENQLSVMMIDVGQGDAILLNFPDGKTALIDAGDASYYFDAGEKIILPLLDHIGIDKIDYGFISHLDSDHYAGFVSLIHHNKIKKIFKPYTDSSMIKGIRLENYLLKKGIPFENYSMNVLSIGNVKVYCMTGEIIKSVNISHNNKSGLIKIVYGETEILLTGDIERQAENYYSETFGNFLESDVLKVAHHGSKTSSTSTFIEKVNPKISLISAGIQNKFKHPSPEVVERLNKTSLVLRTDLEGAIMLASDGKKFSRIAWK